MTDDGTVLWERRSTEPVAVASATKIVTALVVVDRVPDLSVEVTVSAGAAATEGGKLSLEAGERFTVEELLYGLMLNSSNDAAVALAEHVSGSEAAFADAMTDLARSLGASDSAFVTAHGLDRPGHVSTAADLATLFAALLDDPILAQVVGTAERSIDSQDRSVTLENTNELLEGYPGMIGGKTGFTGDAGNVLVAAVERDGRRIISVALGSVDHFADTVALLDHAYAALARTVLVRPGRSVGWLLIAGAGAVDVVTGSRLRGPYERSSVITEFRPSALTEPVRDGDVVGTVVVRSGSVVVGRVDALASGDARPADDPGWLADTLGGLLRAFSSVL